MYKLDDIIRNKQREVQRAKQQRPVSELFERIQTITRPRVFFSGLQDNTQVAVIAEIKKASPSAGLIRADFDPAGIAKIYASAGAGAISVLTDEKYFQGELSYLSQAHTTTELPCLRKDFMIDPYQVMEARAYHADIILLIVAILSDAQFEEMLAAAQEFNLECLVEVHNTAELDRAMKLVVPNIGINNRDLTTLEVDKATTDKLLPIIPKNIIVVSESGLQDRKDVANLGKQGVDAVLVGESLMRAQDMNAALQEFIGAEKWSR